MYLRVDDLGQPNLPGNPVPMPPQPPPPGPGPAPMPNPGIPTPPPVPSLSIAVVGTRRPCTPAKRRGSTPPTNRCSIRHPAQLTDTVTSAPKSRTASVGTGA